MAEHPIIMENKQMKVFVKPAGQSAKPAKESVVDNAPKVSDPKKTVTQRLSEYAFGEPMDKPGEYIWKSYLEPTGKRVANDVVEHFLKLILHTFQRWIWHGKTLDDGKWGDRTSFSNISSRPEQIQARVKLNPVKELTFGTRAEAARVLDQLKATIRDENGHMVTVREYYELSGCPNLCEQGVSSASGWTNLDKAEISEQADGDGFYIKLPRPVSLSSGN